MTEWDEDKSLWGKFGLQVHKKNNQGCRLTSLQYHILVVFAYFDFLLKT